MGAKRDGSAHVGRWRGIEGTVRPSSPAAVARHTGETARCHPGSNVPST